MLRKLWERFRPRVVVRPRDYLLVTRELDVYFVIIWAIYGAWGIAASIKGVETITLALGPAYNFIWSLAIGILGSVACLTALSLFYRVPYVNQVVKKKIEMTAVVPLFILVALYPVYLGILGFGGDDNRIVTFILSILYVIIPFMRMRNLHFRIKNYGLTRN